MHQSTLLLRLVGYVGSLLLTLATFFIVLYPHYFHLKVGSAIFIILCLAVGQAIVQAICFLHILSEKGPRWNLIIFAFTVSGIVIIILGSIWIMQHLYENMM